MVVVRCKISDLIQNKSKDRVGEVVKVGRSGNYDILYVDFNDGSKLVRVNPMDDAQVKGRFYRVKD